jgi:hypothetical protein
MPSPFPGMNPYLEQDYDWHDFHTEFNVTLRAALAAALGRKYFVKVEMRLIVHEFSAKERRFLGIADVRLSARRDRDSAPKGTTVLDAPLQLQLPAVEITKQRFLEIRDARSRRLVTVIEVLSPSNKTPGADRDSFLAKRAALLQSQCHYVEIDLLRDGTKPDPPKLPKNDYYVLVSRYQDRPTLGVWPFGLRDPLPRIPIPLTAPDPDATIDLKTILDRAYDEAGFANHIYLEKPQPPLSPKDAKWAKSIVARAAAGR